MKRRLFYRIGLAVLVALLLLNGACKGEKQQQGAHQGAAGMPAPAVGIKKVSEQNINPSVELPGRVSAYRVAEVRPQVSGILLKRLFVEGSEVKEGQVLYQIDPALYKATVESSKAQLVRAEAVENSARQKAARYRTLVQTKAVSTQDQVEVEASWKQAEADVAANRAALESAIINLNYTKITAPSSGRIGKSLASEGALVTAQQGAALATIQQLDPLYIDVSQSANVLLDLKHKLGKDGKGEDKEETQVKILLPDNSLYQETGKLEFSDVTVDQGTGSVTLRAIVPNPDRILLPGMFIRARLISAEPQAVLLVPQLSVMRTSTGMSTVMIVNNANKVETRLVETGQNVGQDVVIEKGLASGDSVIVSGLQKIRPGADVQPTDAQEKPAQPSAKVE